MYHKIVNITSNLISKLNLVYDCICVCVQPSNALRFTADCSFTLFIVTSCVIILWRGMWNLLAALLIPENQLIHDVGLLAAGYSIIGFLFVIQTPSSFISVYLQKYSGCKIVFEDLLFLIVQWGNLLLWRGGYNLCCYYLLPDSKLGAWLSHLLGTFGLIALQVFCNMALNGVNKDGQHPNGEGLYPTSYLREYLRDAKVIKI